MHLPPPASWEAGSASWPGRLVCCLLALALLLVAGFCFGQRWSPHSLILLSAFVLSMVCAWAGLRRMPRGSLRWDGGQWHWAGTRSQTVLSLSCALDWQACMLLHIKCADGQKHWLWLQGNALDRRWLAMRRALVADGRAQAIPVHDSLP